MHRHAVVTILLVLSSAAALEAQGRFTEERTARLEARGVRRITIVGEAGELRVRGREGATAVVVQGTARASSREHLEDIRLIAQRNGDVIRIEADIADINWRRYRNVERALDLVIEVPAGVAVDVEDGSGSLEISGTGELDVHDGSGEIEITDINGSVRIRDGSGEMRIRNVTGVVLVDEDGSGDIDIADVTGAVVVDDDGSGDLTVNRVGGSFTVRSKGSGSITHYAVQGEIDTPARWNDRRWRSRVRVRTD